jgi:hypothetical protein
MKRWLGLLLALWVLLKSAWSTPSTRTTGTLITASIYNTDIIGNLLALKDPPEDFINVTQGTDFTTTSTSFADISATWLFCEITTDGGDLEFFFQGVFQIDSARISLDISEVGVGRVCGGDGIIGLLASGSGANTPMSFTYRDSFAAGTYEFRLQWKVSADTGRLFNGTTAGKDWRPQFRVQQVA